MAGHSTAIADLDIVNPYFRTRECEETLTAYGIQVYSSNFTESAYEDTPGMAPEIASCFIDRTRKNVIDVGGDPEGARVLGRYREYIPETYEMWLVVNANRYQTQNAQTVGAYLKSIEMTSRLKVTGLINNTHNCSETTVEDILRGQQIVREVASAEGIPPVAVCYERAMEKELEDFELAGERLVLSLYHRPGWMKYQ